MAGLFFLCALAYEWMMDPTGSMYRKYLFLLIYALTFLFSNFGPNTTSFVIPGEIFPAEVRATCHGISAASGKLGAATGAFFFPHLLGPDGATAPTTAGIRLTMLVCGIVAVLGVAVTYLFIPTYDASMLVQEGNYLALDHAFLRPCDVDLMLLDGYECVEVEESDPAATNSSNFYTSSYKNYGASDGATTNETSDFEQGKGIPDRSGKYYTASNNPQPMKYVASSHHDGYNQIQGRDELY
uniref:Major facilitator superfamily (MFS) profile domain-containing protein n=1 Tax=Spumella elongata TaxID=89044 RepID=A0A7S3H6B0_9STRA|mmetsp:Transcript_36363/g.62745  ORF Transcript_36363/g.62745 Transcript_36363/m.62745 type:complete len:241 (+) Transcript_36363:2-724(+)